MSYTAPIDLVAWLARPTWMQDAACRGVDPDLFYPERGADTTKPKGICRGCPVRGDCIDYALINVEKFGIWGGFSERERRALRRKIRVPVVAAPIEHGTRNGAKAHYRLGEKPCPDCLDAQARYQEFERPSRAQAEAS